MTSKSTKQPRNKSGFSLIVTITMMILLSLIAVGLLSLSTISVRSSTQSLHQLEARANARLAMSIAIGELQKALGPDQRISATADLAGFQDGSQATSGSTAENDVSLDGTSKGLSSVRPGTRYWTGVFVNRDEPRLIYQKTPSAELVRWLVSSPNDPTNSFNSPTPSNAAYEAKVDGSASDPNQAIVLVGPNTTNDTGNSAENYVTAPLVSIYEEDGNTRKGAYAWWVGDEGVKSRANLRNQNELPDDYDTLTSQWRGWDAVTGWENYPTPADGSSDILPNAITLPTLDLLTGQVSRGNRQNSGFHSATTDSRGLLTDPLEGGFKVDLTTTMENGLPDAPGQSLYDNYPSRGNRVIPQLAARSLTHLTWDRIEEFYNLSDNLEGGSLVVGGEASPGEYPIAPTVVDFRILMGVRMEQGTGGTRAEPNYNVLPCGKFAVTIANPYSVPLKWDDDLEFQIKNMTPAGNSPSRIWQLRNNGCVYIPNDELLSRRGGRYTERSGRENAVFNQAIFTVPSGSLAPGEAQAFTHTGRTSRRQGAANSPISIPMSPFSTANPFDFNNCVEMQSSVSISLPQVMDVRESWQTTLLALDMRLSNMGSRSYLTRIAGIELDNGYFSPNQRNFTQANTSRLTGPIAMMLYSFQISQPGMDYLNLMPRGYEAGQRASTIRTYADFNLQAANFHTPITSYNPPPFFMESNDSAALLPFRAPGGETGTGFTRNLALDPVRWGHSYANGSDATVLYTVPRSFSSLAQLQHADLTNDEIMTSIAHQPAYAMGNSYATPFVSRDSVQEQRVDYTLIGSPDKGKATQENRTYFDISYLLNASLWDRYFFSTFDQSLNRPRNPNFVINPDQQQVNFDDPTQSASAFFVEGAFNVNSTNVDSWKALLASTRFRSNGSTSSGTGQASYPRSLEQIEDPAVPPTGAESDSLAGSRALSDNEIDALAQQMVREVRKRGPFLTLSHFVNRSLADFDTNPELGRSGAMQMALDESGINIDISGTRNGFTDIDPNTDRVTLAHKNGAPRADLDGTDPFHRPDDANRRVKDWAVTSRDNNFGAVASILADRNMLYDSTLRNEQGYRSTSIPAWVNQADILQVLGPSLTVRSDTFRIRVCGRSYFSNGQVAANAYAEGVVQRLPEFLDNSDPATQLASNLQTVNQSFGRRFQQISFRWLTENEI